MGGLLSSALVLTRSPEGWDGPGLVHTRPWQSGRVSAGLQAMATSRVVDNQLPKALCGSG